MPKDSVPGPGMYPTVKCHKCGKRYWENCIPPRTWECVYCGNLLYFSYGDFTQQIDLVMRSVRHKEFVKSPCGQYIVPKTRDSLRKVRFEKKTTKICFS